MHYKQVQGAVWCGSVLGIEVGGTDQDLVFVANLVVHLQGSLIPNRPYWGFFLQDSLAKKNPQNKSSNH